MAKYYNRAKTHVYTEYKLEDILNIIVYVELGVIILEELILAIVGVLS